MATASTNSSRRMSSPSPVPKCHLSQPILVGTCLRTSLGLKVSPRKRGSKKLMPLPPLSSTFQTYKLRNFQRVQHDLAPREFHHDNHSPGAEILDRSIQLFRRSESGREAHPFSQRNIDCGLELIPSHPGDPVLSRLRPVR